MDAYNTNGSFVDKEKASKALEEAQKQRDQVRELQKQLNELDGRLSNRDATPRFPHLHENIFQRPLTLPSRTQRSSTFGPATQGFPPLVSSRGNAICPHARAYCEASEDRPDPETTISGQYDNPVRVIAFNAADRPWPLADENEQTTPRLSPDAYRPVRQCGGQSH